MRTGLLGTLRTLRRWFAHAVMLAFVLPAMVGLLPQPALSASATLDRDLMTSVCGQSLPGKAGGGEQHQAMHDHCVLCGNHCPSCSPALNASAPAFAALPHRRSLPQQPADRSFASPLQALLDAHPPRGPPAA